MSSAESSPCETQEKNTDDLLSINEQEVSTPDSCSPSASIDEEIPAPRKRGRPRKNPLPDPTQPKRPRGRPRKETSASEKSDSPESPSDSPEEKPPKKRGRPRKIQPEESDEKYSPTNDSLSESEPVTSESTDDPETVVKRKRGRPKKILDESNTSDKITKKQPAKSIDIPIEDFPIEIEPNMPKDRLNFYSINVGLGNVMIMTVGTKAVIFDAGSMEKIKIGLSKFDIFPEFIDPAISILKGKEIVAVIITHPHKDHYNLLIPIIQKSGHRTRETQFICGGSRDQYSDSMTLYLNSTAIFSLDPAGVDSEEAPFTRNESFVSTMKDRIEQILNTGFSESGVKFEAFLPRNVSCNIKDRGNIHITSMIMFKITYKQRSILVTGDATTQAVTNLGHPKGENPFGEFDIYCVPHHGSNNNSRHGVFCKVVPKLLICSADATRYRCWENGLPRSSLIRSLEEDIPNIAPEHTIRYWDNYPSTTGSVSAPPPLEMRTQLPMFTTGDSFFQYREKVYAGIHVIIDPTEDGKGSALLECVRDNKTEKLSIDDYAVVEG